MSRDHAFKFLEPEVVVESRRLGRVHDGEYFPVPWELTLLSNERCNGIHILDALELRLGLSRKG